MPGLSAGAIGGGVLPGADFFRAAAGGANLDLLGLATPENDGISLCSSVDDGTSASFGL
jgi:hypothetical protein